MLSGVVITRSAGMPSLTLTTSEAAGWNAMATLWPLAFSNIGTSSSSASRIAVEETTLISAAGTAVPIMAALSAPIKMAVMVDLLVMAFPQGPGLVDVAWTRTSLAHGCHPLNT